MFFIYMIRLVRLKLCSGREVATGREVAIKKIKVGQFKDGLDMSAIREVKYLREIRHQNVIEVRLSAQVSLMVSRFIISVAPGRILVDKKPESGSGISRL